MESTYHESTSSLVYHIVVACNEVLVYHMHMGLVVGYPTLAFGTETRTKGMLQHVGDPLYLPIYPEPCLARAYGISTLSPRSRTVCLGVWTCEVDGLVGLAKI